MNWRHTSARQFQRVLAGAAGADKRLLDFADEAAGQCELRQVFDKAPRLPVAGRSTAFLSDETVQVGLLFLGDAIARHATDLHP